MIRSRGLWSGGEVDARATLISARGLEVACSTLLLNISCTCKQSLTTLFSLMLCRTVKGALTSRMPLKFKMHESPA